MSVQINLYVVVLAVSAFTTLITSFLVLKRPGTIALGGMLLGMFVWCGAYAMLWSSVGLDEKVLWLKVMYLGVVAVPGSLLIFVLQMTRQKGWQSSWRLFLLGIEPLIIVLLMWLRIDLVFKHINLGLHGSLTILNLYRGVGYWINAIYSYVIILLACFILWRNSRHANSFFRGQYLLILFATLIPYAASVVRQISHTIIADLDLTPASFSISSILYVYAVFRQQLMDLLPIARGRLIESMSDGVLVLDAQGRIVDINPAMQNFLKDDPVVSIGKEFTGILDAWTHNADLLLHGPETHKEIRLSHDSPRYLDLRVTPLYDDNQKLSGHLIVFRDITARKEVEKDLRRFNDRLQTQLIEIGLLQKQLREQAIRDALTNAFNRRYLDETLERELARAERESYPLSVIMMDLDHFKEINDTYGHEGGDVVLKTLADTVKHESRHGDFVCRFGGEEFVLVMPNISLSIARERAEEFHKTINALNIKYGRFILNTTISMGIAMYPEHGGTKAQLLRAADQAMYVAKHTGRNRVVVYEEAELSAR